MGPTATLESAWERKCLVPVTNRTQIPRPPARSPSVYRLIYKVGNIRMLFYLHALKTAKMQIMKQALLNIYYIYITRGEYQNIKHKQ